MNEWIKLPNDMKLLYVKCHKMCKNEFAQTLIWATQFKIVSYKKCRLIKQSQLSKNLHACLTKQWDNLPNQNKKTQGTYLMATTVRTSAL